MKAKENLGIEEVQMPKWIKEIHRGFEEIYEKMPDWLISVFEFIQIEEDKANEFYSTLPEYLKVRWPEDIEDSGYGYWYDFDRWCDFRKAVIYLIPQTLLMGVSDWVNDKNAICEWINDDYKGNPKFRKEALYCYLNNFLQVAKWYYNHPALDPALKEVKALIRQMRKVKTGILCDSTTTV